MWFARALSRICLFQCLGCDAPITGKAQLCSPCLNWCRNIAAPREAAFPYSGPIPQLLSQLRKETAPRTLHLIVQLVLSQKNLCELAQEFSMITSVPTLSRNSALPMFVQTLAQGLGKKTAPQILEKTRTHAQHGKTERERVNCPAFIRAKAQTALAGEKILIIDDVWTTGVSLEQSSLALLRAGASAVYPFALAKTLPYSAISKAPGYSRQAPRNARLRVPSNPQRESGSQKWDPLFSSVS